MEELKALLCENQNLKEILEVAKQITSDLDFKRITKSINYFVKSRFDARFCLFILPAEIDDNKPLAYYYQGTVLKKELLAFASLSPLIEYFMKQEYNQISFSQFAKDFPDEGITKILGENKPEFLVPLKSDKGITGIYLQGAKSSGHSYNMEEIQFMVNLLGFASIAFENANLYRRATIDRMTKLYNHHQFQKTLDEYIEKCSSTSGIFTLLIFDIDLFKKFNDNYGHLQGDAIIKELAALVLRSVREVDYPARYGGEEFAVILHDTNIDGGYEFAERLRKKIESFPFPGESKTFNVTVSIGVAEFDPVYVKCNDDIISAADKALYLSKEAGRNKVTKFIFDN